MVPGETESDSVLVHGPAALVENVPAGELERSVTCGGPHDRRGERQLAAAATARLR